MEISFAAHAPYQHQRPAPDVPQGVICNACPIGGQLLTARHLCIGKEPLDVFPRCLPDRGSRWLGFNFVRAVFGSRVQAATEPAGSFVGDGAHNFLTL